MYRIRIKIIKHLFQNDNVKKSTFKLNPRIEMPGLAKTLRLQTMFVYYLNNSQIRYDSKKLVMKINLLLWIKCIQSLF